MSFCWFYVLARLIFAKAQISLCSYFTRPEKLSLLKSYMYVGILPKVIDCSKIQQLNSRYLINSEKIHDIRVFGLTLKTYEAISGESDLKHRSSCHRENGTNLLSIPTYEPPPDKTNKMACVPSEDSDQPGHPPRLISLRYALNG